MHCLCVSWGIVAACAAVLLLWSADPGYATERHLADFQDLSVSLPTGFTCKPEVTVTVQAPDESAFTGDRVELQKLIGGLRAILGFECPDIAIAKILIIGEVSGQEVYQGAASENGDWLIEDLQVPAMATVPVEHVTITRVWARDGNGKDKPSFAPGDAIQYTTLINNSSSQPVTMSISFKGTGPMREPGYAKDIYFYRQDNVTVSPGLSGWYSPSTIPSEAEGGIYTVGIGLQILNQPGTPSIQQSNLFTVTPVGGLSIPSTGVIKNLFLDTRFGYEKPWYNKYYDQKNVLHELVPGTGPHSGVDIAETIATCEAIPVEDRVNSQCNCQSIYPVYPAAPGKVVWAGWDSVFGWSVVIKHGYDLMYNGHYTYTLYAHMGTTGVEPCLSQTPDACIKKSKACLQVHVGALVYTTTILGYQGSSGYATARHLHFMVFAGRDMISAEDGQEVAELSSPRDLVNKYASYPASLNFYTCMSLTLADPAPLPIGTVVTQGQNECFQAKEQ